MKEKDRKILVAEPRANVTQMTYLEKGAKYQMSLSTFPARVDRLKAQKSASRKHLNIKTWPLVARLPT